MLLLLLHMFVYGGNVYCWRLKQINYSFIFEFRPGTELRFREVRAALAPSATMLAGVLFLLPNYAESRTQSRPASRSLLAHRAPLPDSPFVPRSAGSAWPRCLPVPRLLPRFGRVVSCGRSVPGRCCSLRP